MPKSVTIGARISADLDVDLRKLAAMTGRSRSCLVGEALKAYLGAEKDFAEALAGDRDEIRTAEMRILRVKEMP